MNETFALNPEATEFHLKKVFSDRGRRAIHTLEEKQSDLPPAPENEDSNKFKVAYLNRNSQLHNHRMKND